MKNLIYCCLVALGFWFLMFSQWTSPYVNFWLTMSIAAVVLFFLSWLNQKKDFHNLFIFKKNDFLIGIAAAAILYAIFYFGRIILVEVLSYGQKEISLIYSTRHQASPIIIGIILFFLIGPAEEIFWRGFIQQRLGLQFGKTQALWITTFIYTVVHIWSFNITLLMASLVCGLFWGWIFLRTNRLWPVIISHALWDLLIFVILPVK